MGSIGKGEKSIRLRNRNQSKNEEDSDLHQNDIFYVLTIEDDESNILGKDKFFHQRISVIFYFSKTHTILLQIHKTRYNKSTS